MIEYRILVKDHNNIAIGEFPVFRNLKFSKRLNNYGECSFEVPVSDPAIRSLVALRRFSVEIYRRVNQSYLGTLVWAGEQVVRNGVLTSDGNDWAEIICYDWFEQLLHRRTPAFIRYDQIDAGMIAWSLIDHTQNDSSGHGDMGITMGNIQSTMNRDREYEDYKVGEAISNLSNVISGFDFEITNDKKFNVYSVKGQDKTETVIFDLSRNLTGANIKEDFVNIVNRAIVKGQSIDDDVVRVTRQNLDFQATNGLREGVYSADNVVDPQTLSDIGDSALRKYQLPLISIDIAPAPNAPTIVDFSVGDLIWITIQKGIYNINKDYRVFEYTVSFDKNNVETIGLTLS